MEAILDVSVVIINWNTRDILRNCLVSVFEQTQGIAVEVIVVDNASHDGSVEMVQEEFPRVALITNEENRGFAAGNNQGLAAAQGRYVLLLNSDTIVLDGAVKKTVAFADAHPEAAVTGCRVLNSDRTPQASCFMFPSALNMLLSAFYLYRLFPKNRFFGRERMTWWDKGSPREVDVVSGCFMMVRREAIEHVGAMDEAFFMYAEETDWCYRFKKAGWKVMFMPEACIIHLGRASSQRVAQKMRLQLSGSILYFLKKHGRTPEYVLGCALTALFFLVRIPGWVVKACLSTRDRSNAWGTVQTYARGMMGAIRGYRGLCVVARPVSSIVAQAKTSNSGVPQ